MQYGVNIQSVIQSYFKTPLCSTSLPDILLKLLMFVKTLCIMMTILNVKTSSVILKNIHKKYSDLERF